MKLRHETRYGQQGPILGPLIFNIELIDIFFEFENNDTVSYVDATAPCTCANDTPLVIAELQPISQKVFNWFLVV